MSKIKNVNTVTLTKPVTIDGEKVSEIILRKPSPGELRGLTLTNILTMDVSTMTNLLPRISMPPLSATQISSELEPEDFMDLAAKTTLFFVRKEQLEGQVLELDAN